MVARHASCLCAVMMLAGCGTERLAPETVASTWAKQSLEKSPDIVVSIDVAALKRDPFFSKLGDVAMADSAKPYDDILTASRIDVFATIAKTFTAVAYDVGPLSPALAQCFESELRHDRVTISAASGKWIASNVTSHGVVGTRVEMDDHALFEAWLGPGAMDEALLRARWDTAEMWRHLHAMRLRIEGGATPGIIIDARFETSVDAEHAANDFARAERQVDRLMRDVRDEELAKQLREQIANLHVARSGIDLRVDLHLTADFTQYLSRMLERERHPRSRRDGC
jgi:hypothetical protein